ncbi:Carboxypeptidase G2 precursor [Planctomycetes bacterium MalM25]|nr:Carboxypeptidase G2 precursor [Planctomycetes bacterium MalM25]
MTTPHVPEVSDQEAIDLVLQLMAIPGSGGEERAVMDFLGEKLAKAGAPPIEFDGAETRSELGGGIGNGVLRLPGTIEGPRRLLLAHTDTVPVCVGSRPEVRDGIVHSADPTTGLGADDRAGTAVLLTTALALLRSGAPHPPITFLWTVQEEGGINGARNVEVSMLGEPALAFNLDGGSPAKLVIGATGCDRIWIEIDGHPSHAGMAPEKGVSAAAIAALGVADLVENGWHGLVEKHGKTGTTNFGVIEAGVATNVVAERARLHVEARSHDPAFRAEIVRALETAFHRAVERVVSSEGRRGSVRFSGNLNYESFRLPTEDPSLTAARKALRALGEEPEIGVTNGGLDANWITHHGMPCVTIGNGQHDIHTVNETLDLAEFQLARRVAWRLATGA